MKSLEVMLQENNVHIEELHSREQFILKGEIIFESIFQLESLINEVISQRLGAPVAWCNSGGLKSIHDYTNVNITIGKDKDDYRDFPLYALNIES